MSVAMGAPELRSRDEFGIHLMRTSLKSVTKIATAIVRILACLASVGMLLTFPVIKAHNFNGHYRNPETRRLIVRHTEVAEAENATVENVARISTQPNPLLILLNLDTKSSDSTNVEPVLQVTPTRLFLRLKLGASPAGGEDPLV
jgi:hypothetical protein